MTNPAFPYSPDTLDDPSWRQEAHEMVRSHIAFGRDAGYDRDSVWQNLADTLQETGKLEWYVVAEAYFDRCWPADA